MLASAGLSWSWFSRSPPWPVAGSYPARPGIPSTHLASIATAVGVHFLAIGRLCFAGFYWLGGALVTAGIARAIVGIAGGGAGAIKATTGLNAATQRSAAERVGDGRADFAHGVGADLADAAGQ